MNIEKAERCPGGQEEGEVLHGSHTNEIEEKVLQEYFNQLEKRDCH